MVKEILRKSIQIAELKGGDKTLRDSVIRYKKHVENLSYQEMNNVYYYLSTLALFKITLRFLIIILSEEINKYQRQKIFFLERIFSTDLCRRIFLCLFLDADI